MSSLTLGIDTSGAVSVAVADGVAVLAERTDERARRHDEVLLPMIDDVLAEAGGTRADISRVVAGRGPGPFTGLRVGLVSARTIAQMRGAELMGVSSLQALALEAAEAHEEATSVAVALDARRKEVYFALYQVEREGTRVAARELTAPAVGTPEAAARVLGQASIIVGSGAHLYPEHLRPTGQLRHAHAGALIRTAWNGAKSGVDLSSTEPLYLREADAAKPTRRKSALGLGEREVPVAGPVHGADSAPSASPAHP